MSKMLDDKAVFEESIKTMADGLGIEGIEKIMDALEEECDRLHVEQEARYCQFKKTIKDKTEVVVTSKYYMVDSKGFDRYIENEWTPLEYKMLEEIK